MRHRPSLSAILGTLAVVVALAVVIAGIAWDRHRGYNPVDHSEPIPPQPAATGPYTTAMTMIGDSYGQGVNPKGSTWWQTVARRHQLIAKGVPVGSTGYCALGDKGFRAQVPAALKNHNSLIVVAGSRNDISCTGEETKTAAVDILTQLKNGSPGAKIVVVGPLWGSDAPTPAVQTANEATRQAAQQVGAPFVDALGAAWFEGHPELVKPDHAHPIPIGVDVLANHLDEALTQAGAFA